MPLDPKQVNEAWSEIVRTEAGRVILTDLGMRFGFQTRSTLAPDPCKTAWHEGQRSVMVYIGRVLAAKVNEESDVSEVLE